MRNFLKRRLASIPYDTLERALALSLLEQKYGGLRDLARYEPRENLWRDLLGRLGNGPITLLEFGVFRGYSIAEFARINTNPRSRFVGFDSFVGLPEDWFKTMEKGMFDVGGKSPQTDDKRIGFVKGWFQNSLPPFLTENELTGELVVHFDADLYSATLFVLTHLDALKRPYHAIFDEFTGHETRALHNYQQMSGAKVDFFGKRMNYGYPEQVSCLISPSNEYVV